MKDAGHRSLDSLVVCVDRFWVARPASRVERSFAVEGRSLGNHFLRAGAVCPNCRESPLATCPARVSSAVKQQSVVNRSIEPRGAQTSEDMVHGSSVFIQPI
jgi:hypothetical protein